MSSPFDNFLQQNGNNALPSTMDSTTTSSVDGQNFSHDTYAQSAFDSHSLNETAYQSDPFSTQDQWQDTSSMGGQSFSHDTYTQSAFDHNSLTETAYQSDQFSTENQWQQDTDSHSMLEHSLDQEIDSLLNSVDSLDDSNNQNASNLNPPHYHVPHEHFHALDPLEKEHEIHHAFSTPESTLETHHVLRSEVHHYHHIARPNPTTSGGDGSYNDDNSFDAPSSDSGGCVDANGDGVCDSGSGSSNDND